MKEIIKEKEEFEVSLTRAELQMIRELTQNYMGSEHPSLENINDKKTRLSLFVGSSRLLGFNMNDDGSIKRTGLKEYPRALDQNSPKYEPNRNIEPPKYMITSEGYNPYEPFIDLCK